MIKYYTEEQTEKKFDEIMEHCFTLNRAEIFNLGQLIVATSRSVNEKNTDYATTRIAGFRSIIDFLFESKRMDLGVFKELHTLTGYVMGYNSIG